MRLLHVVPTYLPAWRYGGPIHSVHGLCRSLATRGHEVVVATTNVDGPTQSDVPTGRAVDVEGVEVRYFPSRLLRRLYFSPSMHRYLSGAVADFDLVHTHSVFLWPTTAAAHFARKFGKPYVLSPRGMLVKELIERRSAIPKRAWIAAFERRNLEEASAIHSTSPLETQDLARLGFAVDRVVEIPNGVDIEEPLDPANAPVSDLPDRYVLFLGRIHWKKGLDRLLQAIAMDAHTHLVIAGNDEGGYRRQLVRMADELGIAGRIRYADFVAGESKRRLLREAVALVLPSYSENFGNVVLEALAQGTPVITTSSVGLADLVAQEECGLVVAGEPGGLAHAVSRIWNDPTLRRKLGERGRNVIASRFSWEQVARQFEDRYGTLLESAMRGA